MTLEGTKDNMHAVIKPPNKKWYKVSIECLQHPLNIKILKKNQLEAQMNA
jgi:hypothetical protein